MIDKQANLVEFHKEGCGSDFESTGTVDDIMTMSTVNVVMRNIIENMPDNHLTSPNLQQTNKQAASVAFQINPTTPLGVKTAYLTYNTNDTTIGQELLKAYGFDIYSLALSYLLHQNIIVPCITATSVRNRHQRMIIIISI